jgi:hypothetical protein
LPSPIRDAACCYAGGQEQRIHMSREIDNRIVDQLMSTAISSLDSPRGNKVVCTRRALEAALLAAVREAHEIGFLAGQQERYSDLTCPGGPAGPRGRCAPNS